MDLLYTTLPHLYKFISLNISQDKWMQPDSAPVHYSTVVRDYPNETYRHKWLERGGPVSELAR